MSSRQALIYKLLNQKKKKTKFELLDSLNAHLYERKNTGTTELKEVKRGQAVQH